MSGHLHFNAFRCIALHRHSGSADDDGVCAAHANASCDDDGDASSLFSGPAFYDAGWH
jgi:hypothetical protein